MTFKDILEFRGDIEYWLNQSTPIWYEILKNKNILDKIIKPENESWESFRKDLIEKFVLKNEDGTNKTKEQEVDGKIQPVLDFGESEAEVNETIQKAVAELYAKEIPVELYKVSDKNKEAMSNRDFEAIKLARIVEYLY